MSEIPLCKDCRYFVPEEKLPDNLGKCRKHPAFGECLRGFAENCRLSEELCGPMGKWFERKGESNG